MSPEEFAPSLREDIAMAWAVWFDRSTLEGKRARKVLRWFARFPEPERDDLTPRGRKIYWILEEENYDEQDKATADTPGTTAEG